MKMWVSQKMHGFWLSGNIFFHWEGIVLDVHQIL